MGGGVDAGVVVGCGERSGGGAGWRKRVVLKATKGVGRDMVRLSVWVSSV